MAGAPRAVLAPCLGLHLLLLAAAALAHKHGGGGGGGHGAAVGPDGLPREGLPAGFPKPAAGAQGWSVLLDASGRHAALVHGLPPDVPEAVAWGSFTDSIDETGWAVLDIHTSADYGGAEQSYAAGFLEGALTCERMRQHQRNNWGVDFHGDPVGYVPPKARSFSAENLRWMRQEAKKKRQHDPYWRMVSFLMEQLRGLTDGYNAARGRAGEPLAPLATVLMSSVVDTDMSDLETAFVAQELLARDQRQRQRHKSGHRRHKGHCSAMVQPAPGNTDLWTGHATWDSYRGMLRIVKYLDMPLPGAASQRMVFTSQPGSLYSADDFYVVDTGLTVIETTIANYNDTLWKQVHPASVLTWVRSMVANRLATTGSEWTDLQLRHQSGTCNNQWMVVDYKRFHPGKDLQDGLLWVSETMPGHSQRADVTNVLVEQGSWASYNIPYFKSIWTVGGYEAMEDDSPDAHVADEFSLSRSVRGRMFARARAEGGPKTVAEFMRLLRYNRRDDPLAGRNACNGISARCDLNPQWSEEYDCFGAVDAKVTSYRRSPDDLTFMAVSSPAFSEQEPPFSWRKQNASVDGCKPSQHVGHPDTFNFRWYTMPSRAHQPKGRGWGSHEENMILALASACGLGLLEGHTFSSGLSVAAPLLLVTASALLFGLRGRLFLRKGSPSTQSDDYVLITA